MNFFFLVRFIFKGISYIKPTASLARAVFFKRGSYRVLSLPRSRPPALLVMDESESESEVKSEKSDAFLVLYFFSISDILKGVLWVITT